MKSFRYILFLLSFLWAGFLHIRAQEMVVTYSVDANERIEAFKKEFLKPDADATMRRMASVSLQAQIEAQKSTYSLAVNESISYFYLNKIMLSDVNSKTVNEMARVNADKGEFYQNTKTKQVLERLAGAEDTVIAYSFDFFDWQLTSETENILGYTCYKATTTYTEPHPAGGKDLVRHITVWFAPDIPLSFGPQGYGGLPGLILKKCQSGTCFIADKIEEKKVKIALPKEETITREAYFNQFKKANPFGF